MSEEQGSYRVEFEPDAWDELIALPTREAERIFTVIEGLEIEPRPSGVVKLTNESGLYRVRSGNYRVIYDIQDNVLLVLVVKVAKRGTIYKKRK